jgi:hypothetical protein
VNRTGPPPAGQLLDRVGAELGRCADALGGIEDVVLRLVDRQGPAALPPVGLQVLQDIDRLSQTLAELAAVLGSLAPTLEGPEMAGASSDVARVLGRLKLADLRARLEGLDTSGQPEARVELF